MSETDRVKLERVAPYRWLVHQLVEPARVGVAADGEAAVLVGGIDELAEAGCSVRQGPRIGWRLAAR